MTSPRQYTIAFDCGKEDYSAAILLQDEDGEFKIKATRKFRNSLDGFGHCKAWIIKHKKLNLPLRITMEATGNYYENLALYYHRENYRVSVVLPNKAKRYLQSLGQKSKTDKIDSIGLCKMGAQQNLAQWQPFSESIYGLRQLTRYCEQLLNHKTQLDNQLSSYQQGMYRFKDIEEKIESLIENLSVQIAEIKQKIEDVIVQDPLLKQRSDGILPIKGVGMLTIATLIAETNGFELFTNERQLCSYAGYDVVENQSGKRNGKTKISKKGNKHIRRIMHMPALNVVRYKEPKFIHVYERIMSRNTKKMIAYTAIQRKLLCLIFTLWKKNETYNPMYEAEKKQLCSSGNEDQVLF